MALTHITVYIVSSLTVHISEEKSNKFKTRSILDTFSSHSILPIIKQNKENKTKKY